MAAISAAPKVAKETGPVRNDQGSLALVADRTLAEVPSPGIVLVPGGLGSRDAMHDETILDRLRTADATSTWTTSVCTGSLVLAGAGLGRIAGDEVAQTVQLLTEYDPQPPYDAGSPEKAPAEIVAHWRGQAETLTQSR
ncbi:MAG TPA: DJ-1/PfpI family protein [Streptomyces sp.]|nr:DJ-1/PfpI family protein [Streptomyces sp.]